MKKDRFTIMGPILTRSLEVFILLLIFFFLNLYAFPIDQFPDVTFIDGKGWQVMPGIVFATGLVLFSLYISGWIRSFISCLYSNYWLVIFLLYAFLSILWTVYLEATLYELVFLSFSVLAASYIAVYYRLQGFIDILTWIAGLCVLASLSVIVFTDLGVMRNVPFVGSWHGIFWHRNHAGSLMAFFNMIFLFRFLMDEKSNGLSRGGFALLYLLSAVHVFGSRSAAGILIFVFLNMTTCIFYIWLKWHSWLKSWHYKLFFTLLAMGIIVFITNLSFFFGLLGRTANMTGRTPLWEDLFFNFYLQKPVLGFGFGTLWMQEEFRHLMQVRHNWTYPVYFADNGFIDILLNLGAIGLFLFLGMFIKTLVRGVQKIIETYSWKYIFLILVLLYIIMGNLAYSFLLEVDYFVWALLVIIVFLVQMPNEEMLSQNNISGFLDQK